MTPAVKTKRERRTCSPIEWLLSHVEVADSGCWLWTRPLRPDGYADMSVNSRKVLVHRLAYEELVGPIPVGTVLDHLCRVRHCAAPGHLEAVPQVENVRRGTAAQVASERMLARTHCKNGHQWSETNTVIYSDGKRHCRACRRAQYEAKVFPRVPRVYAQRKPGSRLKD